MIDGELESAEERETLALALNGITRVKVSHYLVDGYRYTSLADAMAQVRRSTAPRAQARQAGLFGQLSPGVGGAPARTGAEPFRPVTGSEAVAQKAAQLGSSRDAAASEFGSSDPSDIPAEPPKQDGIGFSFIVCAAVIAVVPIAWLVS